MDMTALDLSQAKMEEGLILSRHAMLNEIFPTLTEIMTLAEDRVQPHNSAFWETKEKLIRSKLVFEEYSRMMQSAMEAGDAEDFAELYQDVSDLARRIGETVDQIMDTVRRAS